jgi:hypothetical protein
VSPSSRAHTANSTEMSRSDCQGGGVASRGRWGVGGQQGQ